MDKVEVPKKNITQSGIRNLFKLYGYMKPYMGAYILGMFFLLGASLLSLAFPKLLGDMVNSDGEGLFNWNTNQIAIALAIILLAQAVFSYFRTVLFVNVTEKTIAGIRQAAYNHIIKLPVQFFERRRVGELNSRISADITLLQETLTNTLAEFLRQVIIIIGGTTLLAITSVKLTLFMLVILPPVMVMARIFGRFIRKFSKDVQAEVADSNTLVEETLQGIQAVKAFVNENLEITKYKKRTNQIARLGIKGGKYKAAFYSFIIFGLFGAISAVVWQGTRLMTAGDLAAGDLFSFVIYSVFVGGNIGGLASVYTNIQKFIGATEDLLEIFKEEEEKVVFVENIAPEYKLQGNISLKNLNFSYPSRPEELVLKDINVTIEQDKVTALVGPSGSGKTTLSSLLLMLHYPAKEQLYFDDLHCYDIPLNQLRSQIALVPQDIFLFGTTIRENISYGRPNASEEEIIDAAQKANAMEFINRFPEGMDTLVGERGTQLSGGQRQRIAIARAVLKNPRILILDEATSSLDSESEKLVQDALEKLMNGRTSIVIAHRLSTVRKAHNILVMDSGVIVEQGTHEKLINLDGGMYKNLTKLQFAI